MTMRGVTHLATATTASTPTLTASKQQQQQQQHSATGSIAAACSSSSSRRRRSIGGISASGGGVLSSVRSRHQNLFTLRPRDGSLRRRSRHRLLDEGGGRGASTATRAKKGEEDGHGRDETTAANVESCLTVDTMMMGALRIEEEEEEGKRAKASPAPLGAGEINDESIPRRQQQQQRYERGQLQVVHAMGRGGRGRGRGRGRRSGGGRGRGRNRGPWRNPNQGPLRNEQLLDFEELRVLGPEKEMLGVMNTEEALEKGQELGLDLVIVSPEADPPVAKLMDYSKYKYEKEKKDREKKRQAKLTQVELKEVKMRYNIDTHDYDVRLRSSQKFLSNGDKVKVICQFRGRENDFRHIGREMFDRFMQDIEEYGTLEKQPGMEGNAMTMYIIPRVTKDEVNKRR